MKQTYKIFIFLFILLLSFEGLKFVYFSIAYISELIIPQFYMNVALNSYMNFKTSIDSIFRYSIPVFALCLGGFTGIVYIILKDKLDLNTFKISKIQGSKYIKFSIQWILIISILQVINYGVINLYQMRMDYLFKLQIFKQGINSFYILGVQGFMLFITTYLLIVYSTYLLYIMISTLIKQSKTQERLN